jgi:hypothetical protein
MRKWCKGCPGGDPHYDSDYPDWWAEHTCQHYVPRLLDQEVVDEIQIQTLMEDIKANIEQWEKINDFKKEIEKEFCIGGLPNPYSKGDGSP